MPRFMTFWRNKWLTAHAKTLDDMIDALRGAANELESMKNDGVVLEDDGAAQDDYATLITEDPEVAKKYQMESETEMFGYDEEAFVE